MSFKKDNLDYYRTSFGSLSYRGGLDYQIYSKSLFLKMYLECHDNFFREFPYEYIKENLQNIKWGA